MSESTPDLGTRDALSGHPFLSGLGAGAIDRLTGMSVIEDISPGSWLLRQGAAAGAFRLVLAGRAAVELASPDRDPLVVATVHEGDVIGWSWLYPPHVAHFDVIALDPVRAVSIDAGELRTACAADHDLGFEIAYRLGRVVAARLEATRLQLMDVYGRRG